ncbi:hypothetical protein [Acidovorax sp.]|uniref:hypothetical protein n=1 Tax=Acidovorax sp. TaxID=1872122 RepID=UPI00391D845D
MTLTPATRALWLAPLLASAALPALARSDFIQLRPAHCEAVGSTAPLPAELEPYRPAVRACPLVRPARPSQPAQVRLLSVFTEEYYKDLPANAPWQNFPLPVLVDTAGRCVGRLPHLFPVDPPQELIVRAGQWRNGIPHELRLQVLSPAVSGNYTLPTLRWQTKAQAYQPVTSTAYNTPSTAPAKDKTPCP